MKRVRVAAITAPIAVIIIAVTAVSCLPTRDDPSATGLEAILLSADQASGERLDAAAREGVRAVVLELRASSEDEAAREREAALGIRRSGLDLYYWIEVARDPSLATAHPEWMASLQGHDEWRRLFPDAPRPREGEVVKNYPWVPILYREAFEAHLARIGEALRGMPEAAGIFLNDLQGGPSACGCGNALCRWTADYGPVVTAMPLGVDAAGRFVAAVKRIAPESEVIPVWTTECEEHDGAEDGACAGVGCYGGRCWKEYAARLGPVLEEVDRLGVLLLFRELGRDLPVYRSPAGWARSALESFAAPPPGVEHPGRPRGLIAVLQGFGVAPGEIEAQKARAREGGASGYVVSFLEIDQGWEPRLVETK